MLAVRNERGEEITRQVVGVGVLAPDDVRSFSLAVELFAPQILQRDVRIDQRDMPQAPRPTQSAVHRSPFRDPRDPRTRLPQPGPDSGSGRGGPPPLPRDPRPPAAQTQVRTLPAGAQPVKDRPKQ